MSTRKKGRHDPNIVAELEGQIVGAVLVHGPEFADKLDISGADFGSVDYARIFSWLRGHRDQWQPGVGSLIANTSAMKAAGLLDRIEGAAGVITELMTDEKKGNTPLANIEQAGREFLEHSIVRQRRELNARYEHGAITDEEWWRMVATLEDRRARFDGKGGLNGDLPLIMTLDELDAAYPNDLPLLIAGPDADNERDGAVLALGEVGILGSGSKAGKTWAVIDAALAIATGRSWMGHFVCKPGRVLYVNMELGGRAFVRRTEMLLQKRGIRASEVMPNIRVWHLRNTRAAAVEELGDVLTRHGERFDLVILDPLYRLLGGREENSNGDMAELMQAIRSRFCNGDKTAVLLVHHFPKGDLTKRAALDRFAGAGAIARDADTLITITPEGETFRLEYTTRDYKAGVPMELKMDFPVVDAIGPAEVSSPKAKAQSNHNLLRGLIEAESGMDKTELVKRFMAETGCGKSMAYRAIDKAEKAKAISRTTLEKTYVAA